MRARKINVNISQVEEVTPSHREYRQREHVYDNGLHLNWVVDVLRGIELFVSIHYFRLAANF